MYNFLNKISSQYRKYKIEEIKRGASKRLFYRLKTDKYSVICMDSKKEKNDYNNFIKVHNYLSKINISVPEIYERYDDNNILIMEDFGKLCFDKILFKYNLKDLFQKAVKSLIVLNNEIDFNESYNLPIYNFELFKLEISEFIDYYYPYVYNKKIPENFRQEFFLCWQNQYREINFDFKNFVHKDFNVNNLMYLNSRIDHLKCGILDFQNAYWGESCWDLFSLLEDSRILFDSQYNDYFIDYYYKNTNQKVSITEFKKKYYLLNISRQTRLMGRWIKLMKDFNENFYLDFIPVTKKRLQSGINKLDNKQLKLLYCKIIPDL